MLFGVHFVCLLGMFMALDGTSLSTGGMMCALFVISRRIFLLGFLMVLCRLAVSFGSILMAFCYLAVRPGSTLAMLGCAARHDCILLY